MMKVLLDVSSLNSYRPTGIGIYSINLIKHLQKLGVDCKGGIKYSRFKYKQIVRDVTGVDTQFYLPIQGFLPSDYAIFHGLDFRLPIGGRYKKIVTIHDMLDFEDNIQHPKEAKRGMQALKKMISRSRPDHIVTVSHFIKQRFLHFFPEYDKDRVSAIYLGADHRPLPTHTQKPEIDAPYILYLGTVEKRKNVIRIIEAFEFTKTKYPELKLVIAGGLGFEGDKILDRISKSYYKTHIIRYDYVSDQFAADLFAHALAFVFPSLYEGFGIPVIEAMRLRCPVITSSTNAVAEISKGVALQADLNSSEDIAKKMFEIIENQNVREKLILDAYEHVKQFTWEKCAKETLDLYHLVLKKS